MRNSASEIYAEALDDDRLISGGSMDSTRSAVSDALFLLGPTASGKSDIAEHLAPALEAEIISLDSMSVYRGMDIGTAKPSPEAQRRIPHHLIDIIPPNENFSSAGYVKKALEAAGDILRRNRLPLFVGGTPLYVRLLLQGIFEGPAADSILRAELKDVALSEGGPAALHSRLSAVDPESARRLHPNDMKRVIRALEVFYATGKPISRHQNQWENDTLLTCAENIAIIIRDRDELRRRIDRRVDEMFKRGLVDEVRALLKTYGHISRTARAAVGYAETLDHIESGAPIDETIERVKSRTWQVARKQLTWLRRFRNAYRLEIFSDEIPENCAKRLYMRFRRCHNICARRDRPV